MRSKAFVAAALTAALTAGCRRAPSAPPASAADAASLAAPAPSGSFVTSPLAAESTAYTNAMQAENLRGQAVALGIRDFRKPSDAPDADEPRPPISYEEGLARTHAYAQEFQAERQVLDRDKVKSVALPGDTPGMMPDKNQGAPIETNPGPKDLDPQ